MRQQQQAVPAEGAACALICIHFHMEAIEAAAAAAAEGAACARICGDRGRRRGQRVLHAHSSAAIQAAVGGWPDSDGVI